MVSYRSRRPDLGRVQDNFHRIVDREAERNDLAASGGYVGDLIDVLPLFLFSEALFWMTVHFSRMPPLKEKEEEEASFFTLSRFIDRGPTLPWSIKGYWSGV